MNYTPVDIYNKEKIKRYWVHFTSTLQFESKVFFEATLNSIMHNKPQEMTQVIQCFLIDQKYYQ